MNSRQLLFDLNFKKANIELDSVSKKLILSKAELDSVCYSINSEINKLESKLNMLSENSDTDNAIFIKILMQTQKIAQLLKRVNYSVNNSLALSLIFSEANNLELNNFSSEFILAEQTEKFNSLKNQISYLSYSNYSFDI